MTPSLEAFSVSMELCFTKLTSVAKEEGLIGRLRLVNENSDYAV